MTKVKVVSAFVPLKVKHLSEDQYHDFGAQLEAACTGRARFFRGFRFEACWLYGENPPGVPATETPKDRYETDQDFVNSNIVQHSRTQWALMAAAEDPSIDVIVWLDYGILKQGDFTGKRLQSHHVTEFLDRIEGWEPSYIPFPGITDPPSPVIPHGNNWRFCGSTHIWPVKYLKQIDHSYKFHTRNFIYNHKCTPLDLAIWPKVERHSGLPFRWYPAEYDYTQLTGFKP